MGVWFSALVLLASGALGFAWYRDLLRRVLAFNIMSSGAFLLLVAASGTDSLQDLVLPLLLVLFMGVTALLSRVALTLGERLEKREGSRDPDREPDQGEGS